MTTSSEMRTLLDTNVFGTTEVTDITDKVYSFDVLQESSSKLALLSYLQEIHFVTYICNREHESRALGTNGIEYRHVITVGAYREADKSGAAFNSVIDTLQVIEGRFIANTNTSNWNNTLMPFSLDNVADPTLILIEGKEVWFASNTYTFLEQL